MSQIVRDTGLTAADAPALADDKSTWRALRPTAGYAQQWVSIISGTDKAADFKFGGYVYRAYPNKSPLKILEKKERERIQGLPNFLGTPYYLGNG